MNNKTNGAEIFFSCLPIDNSPIIPRVFKKKKPKKPKRRKNKNIPFSRKHKKQKKTRTLKYREFIKSKAWRNFKFFYWQTHKKICAACDGNKRMCIHHVHYGYLGREREQDVVPLCWTCHEALHNEYGTATVMIDQTNEFIESKRMAIIVKTL